MKENELIKGKWYYDTAGVWEYSHETNERYFFYEVIFEEDGDGYTLDDDYTIKTKFDVHNLKED